MLKQKLITNNRIASVGYAVKEMKWLITWEVDEVNYHRRNIRLSTAAWEDDLLGIMHPQWISILLLNDTTTNQNLSLKMRCRKSSRILRWKQYLILVWRPDLVLINKEKIDNLSSGGFCHFQQTLEPSQRDPLPPQKKTKNKTWRWQWYRLKLIHLERSLNIEKWIWTVEYWRKNRDHSDYCIVEIGQNTEKCPEFLRRIAVL